MSFVIDVDDTNFITDVIERSQREPMLVAFWDGVSEPSPPFVPVLENLAEEFAGAFVLARCDIERSPKMSTQLPEIPLLVLFAGGRPVQELADVRSEAAMRGWLGKLFPDAASHPEEEATASGGHDEASYRKALEKDPKQPAAHLGLARILASRGDLDEAKAHLDDVTVNSAESRPAERLIEALDFWALAIEGVTLPEPAEGAAKEAIDGKLVEAARRSREGEFESALAVLYDALGDDREYRDGLARRAMVALFGYLGETSDATRNWQKRMANLMY